ncbi:MAG: hypothetical protein HKP40_05790 [Litoreibacter sp.]|nr:hypothetical protein [Litoreibacter sp.]
MRAIAEYFRDLAAGDRFFGAEPPQPDADMLHRIAEQTIQQKVNAEVTDNSLILRQADTAEAPVQVEAPEVRPAPAYEEEQDIAVSNVAPAMPEAQVETPVVESAAVEGSVAEKLKRIRAAVASEAVSDLAFDEDQQEDAFATISDDYEPAPADEASGFSDYAEYAAPEMPEIEDAPEEDSAEDIVEDVADEAEEHAAVGEDAEEHAEDAPEEEISAELSEEYEEEELPSEEDMSFEAPEGFEVAEAEDDAEAVAEAETETEEVDEVEADETEAFEAESEVAEIEEVETAEDEAEAEEAAFTTEDEAEEESTGFDAPLYLEPEAAVQPAEDETSEYAEEDETGYSADFSEEAFAAPDFIGSDYAEEEPDFVDAAFGEDEPEATSEEPVSEDGDQADEAFVAADDADDEDEDSGERIKPRVIVQQISRDAIRSAAHEEEDDLPEDVEAALAREIGMDDDVAEDEAETAFFEEEADTSESEEDDIQASDEDDVIGYEESFEPVEDSDVQEEDEADPMEMEGIQSLLEQSAQAEAEDARQARLERRSKQPLEDEESALSRLMDATSTRLEEDEESSVRRASIAHLKAAVAATKADASIAEAAAAEEEREMDQYREDLARVVRPGRARPKPEGSRTDRPALITDQPSPLILVSEQRIDGAEDSASGTQEPQGGVLPRRIQTGSLAVQEEFEEEAEDEIAAEDAMSLADYAESVGATDLPDILEATAAHMTYIEGRDSFTRPMLMRRVSSVFGTENFSRENNLRSFGSLLREGKLVKTKDGTFVIAKTSRFTPEARIAGE